MPPNIPQKDGERSELWSGFNRETCRGKFQTLRGSVVSW